MRKVLILSAVVAAFACSLCSSLVATSADAAFPNKTTFRDAASETKIRRLCDAAKSSFNPGFREYSDGESVAEPDGEFDRAEREYYQANCDLVASSFEEFNATGSLDSFDALMRALGEVRHYQSKSPAVAVLNSALREQFSMPNLYLEASERFLAAMATRNTSEQYPVQETIRGTLARGTGQAWNQTSLKFVPSVDRAAFAIVLNSRLATSVVGTSRNVDVYTDNFGNVSAVKTIYANPDGSLTSTPGVASGSMKSRVKSVDPNRPTPLGGLLIQSKINAELPLSERESAILASRRVAAELDKQVDERLDALNQRVRRMTANADDPMINHMSARTSNARFFFSCVLGRSWQLAVPSCSNRSVAQRIRTSNYAGGLPVSKCAPPSFAGSPSVSDSDCDVLVKLHQSGPNNAATVALMDAEFGPGSNSLDSVIARFPGVDPDDAKSFLTPYEPKEERPLDPEDNYRDVSIRFDDVRPFDARFENGAVSTSLHIASCVSDGKEWPPIEVQLVYRVERRDDSYAFVRDTVEVLPEGYQEGDSVSARFHTFRRILLKRLEKSIQDEYVVAPILLDDRKTGEKRGALIPSFVDVNDGWVSAGFRYDPDYQAE